MPPLAITIRQTGIRILRLITAAQPRTGIQMPPLVKAVHRETNPLQIQAMVHGVATLQQEEAAGNEQ